MEKTAMETYDFLKLSFSNEALSHFLPLCPRHLPGHPAS